MNLVIVDTSVWIEWLRARSLKRFSDAELARIAVCPPIIQELFQGLRPSNESEAFRERVLQLPCLGDPLALSMFTAAEGLYNRCRAKSVTVRSSTDCLIGAVAIHYGVPIMHRDRDYKAIAQVSDLRTVTSLA